MAKSDFSGSTGFKGLDGRTTVGNGVIQARYDKGKLLGQETGFTWFQKIPGGGVNEATMEYKIKFDSGFDWTKGGKIPGLVGGTSPRGCNTERNNLENGFSARCMWRSGGRMVLYAYWHKQNSRCGKDTFWKKNGQDIKIQRGKWYTIREHIIMNTPGRNNGVVEIFLNGDRVLRLTNMEWRKAGKNFKIDKAYWTTYVGGSTNEFKPSRNNKIWFDDFKVWIGCAGNNNPGTGNETNKAPKVSVTSPIDNANFTLGQVIPLRATSSDEDGSIVKVNFKVNCQYHSQDATGPNYTGTFTPSTPGVYKISAKTFDNKGMHAENEITIVVNEPKSPYSGSPVSVPGTVEMEDYDKGGLNVGYMDLTSDNKGGLYREDFVDIDNIGANGFAVGWTAPGEWMDYTVNVETAGHYDLTVFYASSKNTASIQLTSTDDLELNEEVNLVSTGGTQNYSTLTVPNVILSGGKQTIRLNVVNNGFNIDKIVFAPSTVTSTNELSATEAIVVYPNPNSTGVFNLTQITEWSVMSIHGTQILSGNSKKINISDQNKGVYIIQFAHGVSKRVVIN